MRRQPIPPRTPFMLSAADAEHVRDGRIGVVDLVPAFEKKSTDKRSKRTPLEQQTNPYERDIQAAIVKDLRGVLAQGYIVQSNVQERVGLIAGQRASAQGQLSGWPDIGIYGEGRCWLIEVKDKTGALTENQKVMHRKLRAAGIPVLEICRDSWTAIEWLRDNGARVRISQ